MAADLAWHVEVSEDDVKGIRSSSSLQLIHGLLPIHHCSHLTVARSLQYAQCHLHALDTQIRAVAQAVVMWHIPMNDASANLTDQM